MDFYEWVRPMFIFICLYVFKLTCITTQYTISKLLACFAFVILAVVGESHFDRSRNNDAPAQLLAIPVSIILMSQAFNDLYVYKETKDFKKRLFFCMDNPLKKMWIFGNLASTVIYSICLCYWLCIMQYNEHNDTGRREDANVLHLSLGSIIFYMMFLLERVGTY